uniref:FAD-dependent oxidoreductase domain-containing protein 1 n=1 Tax=Latimeria chalumnae TaxID=7897 RepID=H3BEE6_LATCH
MVRKQDDFFQGVESEFAKFREKMKDALPGSDWNPLNIHSGLPPERADIVIVGGGAVGWSTAYWLKKKERVRDGVRVLVVEKDPTYSKSSTVLSIGGIRQQFSMPENIHMSMYSAFFLRNINEYLGVANGDPVDVQFNPSGYLFLASEDGASTMEENYQTQRHEGAKVELLSPEELKNKFPWINTEGIVLASYGLENEGWLDPWSLLNAFRRKALSMGVYHCHGEVTGFSCSSRELVSAEGDPVMYKRISHVNVRMPYSLEYQPVECAVVVNAAGPWSGEVAEMVGVGSGPPQTMAGVKLPVEPKKRYSHSVALPLSMGKDLGFVLDTPAVNPKRFPDAGFWVKGGHSDNEEEPEVTDLEVDHKFFEDKVWPKLAFRIPAFESLKMKSAWAGYYDYNTFDQNAILGMHPLINNLFFATGFSGHGLQQSPAAGRAIAELILDGGFQTIDLNALSFERVYLEKKALEKNIV